MAASLIPERTIDQWISIVAAGVDPTARIWAPTPRAQAGAEPWDHAIDGSGRDAKLIVVESKALLDDSAVRARRPHVSIDLNQLLRLVYLELIEGVPAFYALPSLTIADLAASAMRGPLWWASARLSPSLAGDWIRVPSATDLALEPGVYSSIRSGRKSRTVRTPTVATSGWPGLLERLIRVRRCEGGRLVSPSAPFGPIPGGVLTEAGLQHGAEAARAMLIASGGDRTALHGLALGQRRVEIPEGERRVSGWLERTLWIELSRA